MQGSLKRKGNENSYWMATLKQYLGQILFLAVIFILLSVYLPIFGLYGAI